MFFEWNRIMNQAITIKNRSGLEALIKGIVVDAIQEVLRDPDFDLEIQDWVKKRLREKPKKIIQLDEIKKKFK